MKVTRNPLRGRWFRLQQRFCRQRELTLEHMSFSDGDGLSSRVFDRVIEIVSDPGNQPVLIHCEQGYHRTSVLTAAYRVAICDWSLDQAIEEMEQFGYDVHAPKREPLYQALYIWAAQRT